MIKMSKTVAEHLAKISKEIPFNPEWANGTGYFTGAAKGPTAPVLAVGELAKSVSTDGRKMIFMGTHLGNFVVFQRHSDSEEVFVYNTTMALESIFSRFLSRPLNDDNLNALFDYPGSSSNLGNRLNQVD